MFAVGGVGVGGGWGAFYLDLETCLDTGDLLEYSSVVILEHQESLTCLEDTPEHWLGQHQQSPQQHYPMEAMRPPLIVRPSQLRLEMGAGRSDGSVSEYRPSMTKAEGCGV